LVLEGFVDPLICIPVSYLLLRGSDNFSFRLLLGYAHEVAMVSCLMVTRTLNDSDFSCNRNILDSFYYLTKENEGRKTLPYLKVRRFILTGIKQLQQWLAHIIIKNIFLCAWKI
jgi:hypothetical protein